MAEIVLSTLNAKFIHASFGLRYLLANLGDLRPRAEIAEFEIRQSPLDIAGLLLSRNPRIIGLGIYIWNVRQSLEVVALLRRLRPEVRIILGGPEVSHEWKDQEIVALADHVVTGEADLAFADLCRKLLDEGSILPDGSGGGVEPQASEPFRREVLPPLPKIIPAPLPDLAQVVLPYALYSDSDIAHRVIYVEASRGCPFTCEFCLSSLDVPVRQFPVEPFLQGMAGLLERGARQFKFVDRTFNLNLGVSRAILQFFRERWREGLFLHFEMIPDRLPEALREELAWFPRGAVQLEIGIQSFNPDVCARIRRRQDLARTEDNIRFLRHHTGAHLHVDLIAGLPGESLESFAAGFDRLVAWGPQEIQFGILKRLRGTPIARHEEEWAMCHSPMPPYEILQNRLLDFDTLQRLRRFSRYWDLVANSGRFLETTPLLWSDPPSPFAGFLAFSDWLHAQVGQTHGIALDRLAALLFRWLTTERGLEVTRVRSAMSEDWRRTGRRDLPEWLTGSDPVPGPRRDSPLRLAHARRQRRHEKQAVPPMAGAAEY